MVEQGTTAGPSVDRWDGHQLAVGQQHDDALARWAARGLARGDTLLCAATERHPDAASLTGTLTRYGVDAAGATDDGRIEVVAPERFYDLDGHEQLVEQALRDGAGGVRSIGGPAVASGLLDPSEFAEFERLLDRLWTTRGATALCCYPPAPLTELGEAVRRHPSGWRNPELHIHREHGRWVVHGEVDATNDELFATLLAAAADRAARVGDGPGERRGTGDPAREPLLVLDCAGLDYSGVAAWRAAVAGTGAFRAGGGRVALTGLRPLTVRILHITGLASAFDLSDATDAGSPW